MIEVLLLDLGGTLERHGVVLSGVPEALTAFLGFSTRVGAPLIICLASDYTMPEPRTAEAVETLFGEYLEILSRFELRQFFEPVDQRVTLSTQVGVRKPESAFFEAALRRAKAADTPFGACLFITENGPHVEACRALGMVALQFGVDFARWLDAPPLVAYLVDPSSLRNFTAALQPLLPPARGAKLEAVDEISGRRLRGRARRLVPLDAPDLGTLRGVHVELPVALEATLSPKGSLEAMRLAPPSAEDLAEATDHVRSLLSSEQIAGASSMVTSARVAPTHDVETDPDGRRVLVRRRFTAV